MENKFAFAKEIVYQAGAYILVHLNDCLFIEEKANRTDLVTQIDKKVQENLVKKILARYPQDAILAEENNQRHDIKDGSVWVIDPIDGTTNFITQKSDFAVMLAYFEAGIGQFGLIYDVTRDELYHGGGQFDVYRNQEKLEMASIRPMKNYLMAANSGMLARNEWGAADLAAQTLGVRVYGSAGISFIKVLSGRLLTYLSYIWPWDYAAALVMGEKLGYAVLTFDGRQPDFQSRQGIMMVPKKRIAELKVYIKERELE